MKDKIIKVSEETHKRLKIQSANENLSMKEYIDFIAYSNQQTPIQQLKDFKKALELMNEKKSGYMDENILVGIGHAIAFLEADSETCKELMKEEQ